MMVLFEEIIRDTAGRIMLSKEVYVNPAFIMVLSSDVPNFTRILFPGEEEMVVKGNITEVYTRLLGS